MSDSARVFLRELLDGAVAAVAPSVCVPQHLPAPLAGRTFVVGAGKAAAAMARVVEDHWPRDVTGVVVTRYGHGVPCRRIEVIEAGHPLPDAAGTAAARRIRTLAAEAEAGDLVLCLLSGGGSALLALPAPGLELEHERALTLALMRRGAAIGEINCVRKHLSDIKGGRLALACAPARVHTLAISDVPGDDPDVIASGPTVADPTTSAEALAILSRYEIDLPAAVEAHLRSMRSETPKPGDPRLLDSDFVIVARARDALEAAADRARAAGVTPVIVSDRVVGEAREAAREHARLVRTVREGATPAAPPCVLLSGGETTVTVQGEGRGGRNGEFLLALAIELDGMPGVHAIACDTDGIDGTADNAGCIMTSNTLARARASGIDPGAALDANDSHGFFDALGDLVITGPTRTNVNDFRAILVTTGEADPDR